MGGIPTHALVTLGVPPKTDPRRLAEIYRGLTALARRHRVALVGGETTRAAQLFLSISLLGTSDGPPVLRSGGKPGDDLWVTGLLGANTTKKGAAKHLRFEPRLGEGRWLARKKIARAMMDLSDGLAADLPRLAAASHTGFLLDPEAIPAAMAPGATRQAALRHGEDYELLFAAAPRWRKQLTHWPFKTRLTRIGQLIPAGKGSSNLGGGFDHFTHE